MRLARLRLCNYRGTQECEVEFAPQGLTIVEGANEAGKSSLAEALWLLFDHLDSSRKGAVRAVEPVHHDARPEIELEASSGPYEFTYRKVFHKSGGKTELQISAPTNESHTGREAHARAKEILEETVDVALWRALSLQQGVGVEQAEIADMKSLSAALDRAAGGAVTGDREDSLFTLVQQEHGRYFTETGRPKKNLTEAKDAEEKAGSSVDVLQDQLQKLEQDIERARELEGDLQRIEEQVSKLEAEAKASEQQLQEVRRLADASDKAQLQLQSVSSEAALAARNLEEREASVAAVGTAAAKLEEVRGQIKEAFPELEEANQRLEASVEALRVTRETQAAAEREAQLRRQDRDFRNKELDLALLCERRDRIDGARERAARAEELLASSRIDAKKLATIQKAEREVLAAQGRQETGNPSLQLRALSDLEGLVIDEQPTTLRRGEERSCPVPENLRVTLPGQLDLEFRAGASAAELAAALATATESLAEACAAAGVADAEAAIRAEEKRREAERELAEAARTEEENLRDLDYDSLARKITGLSTGVEDYLQARPAEPAMAADLDAARASLEAVETRLVEVTEAQTDATTSHEAARDSHDVLRAQHQEIVIAGKHQEMELQRYHEALERSRAEHDDDSLRQLQRQAGQQQEQAEAALRLAKESLLAQDPERVEALAETTTASLEGARKRHRDLRDERIKTRERLHVHGESGLYERLQEARTTLSHTRHASASLDRRARAASKLYTTMSAKQEEARRTYVGPLRERIEKLGRILFGSGFSVELDEKLSIVSRTLDDATVPYESLSGGTKEQLSLITRLACAMCVAADGGAPLLFDDALGYTDPQRLREMGAILAVAAKHCQVIVLTCVPDRYLHVGDARVVQLR